MSWIKQVKSTDISRGPKCGFIVHIEGKKAYLKPKHVQYLRRVHGALPRCRDKNKPHEKKEKKEPQDRKQPKETKAKQEAKEAKTDVKKMDLVHMECLDGTRRFLIVPIPKDIRQEYKWPVANQLFFLSSGKSNDVSFSDTYFPTLGINEAYEEHSSHLPSWIMKAETSDRWAAWARAFMKILEPMYEINYLNAKYYKTFLSYFDHWFQMRISAQLGGKSWDDVKEMREYVLNHSWDFERGVFVKDPKPLPELQAPSHCDKIKLPEEKYAQSDSSPKAIVEKIHIAKLQNNALAKYDCLLARTVSDARRVKEEIRKRTNWYWKKS